MKTAKETTKQGFTLTEMIVTIAMAAIVLFGVAVAMVDGFRGWRQMYNRVHGQLVNDAYTSRITFDSVVRKAVQSRIYIDDDGTAVRVYYYQNNTDWTIVEPDIYAMFYISGDQMLVDYGPLAADGSPLAATSTVILANDVDAENSGFALSGAAVQMVLKLDNGREALTVTCSSARHNE